MKKNLIKKGVVLAIVVAFIFGMTSLVTASSFKVEIEDYYAKKAQAALDAMFGEGFSFVVVTVDALPPQYEVKYTKESKPERLKKKKGTEVNILPGYPVLKNLSSADMNKMPFDSITSYIEPKIQKVIVDVYVDKKIIKSSKANKSKALLRKALGLNEKRDVVNVSRETFYKAAPVQQKIEITSEANQLFSYQNLFYLVVVVFMLIFVILYVVFSLRKDEKSKDESGKGAATNVNVNPNIELAGNSGGPSGDLKLTQGESIKQYFDFVNEKNVNKLVYIMKKEKLNMELLSLLVAFLDPKIAAVILKELDVQNKAVMAVNLLGQRMVNKQMVEKLEDQVRGWLECLAGGETTFQSVFNYVSSDEKKKILEVLGAKSPEGYKKVRGNIIIFDDLQYLDDEEILTILSEVSVELLSVAMVSVDEVTYQKIDSNLTKSAKDMIEQFLELKGDNISKQEVEKAQLTVLDVINRLEAEGKVNLRGKVQV
jgi:hypothetical protein